MVFQYSFLLCHFFLLNISKRSAQLVVYFSVFAQITSSSTSISQRETAMKVQRFLFSIRHQTKKMITFVRKVEIHSHQFRSFIIRRVVNSIVLVKLKMYNIGIMLRPHFKKLSLLKTLPSHRIQGAVFKKKKIKQIHVVLILLQQSFWFIYFIVILCVISIFYPFLLFFFFGFICNLLWVDSYSGFVVIQIEYKYTQRCSFPSLFRLRLYRVPEFYYTSQKNKQIYSYYLIVMKIITFRCQALKMEASTRKLKINNA